MTKLMRRAAILLLALTGAMLTSCLELYDEEMIIHADLSGSAKATVKLPDTLMTKFDSVRDEFTKEKIQARFAGLSGVQLISYNITAERFPVATFEVTFTSLQKLSAAVEANDPAQFLVGVFNIKQEKGNSVVERKLGEGKPGMDLPSDKYAIYKMHFNVPIEMIGTNSEYFDKSHNDVRYRWPLATIGSQQPLISNRLLKPMPWMAIAIGFVILCVIARIVLGVLSKRKRHALANTAPVIVAAPNVPPTPKPPQRPGPPTRPGTPR